ncbi:MAG TPA: ABC transporter ATP-binding protein [Firmicutes bacterium]|nr:ABC transporter ATP-binding protein [Bacillota bacterium]HHY98528.1 ABC transporter ATP-binding protein [Bacillota bacterium]
MHGGGGWHSRYGGLDSSDISRANIDLRHIPRLWEFVRPHIWTMTFAMVLVAGISATGLVGPILVRRAIDIYIPSRNYQGLVTTVMLYVAAYSGIAVMRYLQTYIMSAAGQRMLYSIRRKLFVHLQDLGLDFYDRFEAGRIMSRVTNDVDALNQLISSGILNLLSDLVTILGILYVMFSMSPRLALISCVTIPLLVVLVLFMQKRMTRAYHRVRRRLADVNANLQESISGMKIVQAFSREEVNAQRFDETNSRNMQANMEAAVLHSLFFPLVELIGSMGTAAVLYYGGLRISWGDPTVTIGTLVAFINYVTRFFWPIRDMSDLYNLVLAAGVSSVRVFEILDTKPNVEDRPGAIEIPDVRGEVRFEHVTFGYDPALPVLHDINLEARPGETIALVGPTGAGKSSIINLLLRLYDVDEGRITVDGHDIRDLTIESLRSRMGVVLQDTFIFSGTIRENIRYGRLDATDEEVEEAARIVGADRFIERFPEGYDTEVHERGARLSVGQRQLLAFARALLADPRILILDEATSSVDAYTEYMIQQALERLLEGRTAFVIAHRLSTIRNADRIYVIDDGRVVEEGTHEELLARGGRYASLYEKQFTAAEGVS